MQTNKAIDPGHVPALPAAAAQYFDASLGITLAAMLLVALGAFIVMRIYLRAIFRQSQLDAKSSSTRSGVNDSPSPTALPANGPLTIETERPGRGSCPQPARSATFQNAGRAFRRAAYSYVLAGSAHAVFSAGLLFLLGGYAPPHTQSRLTILACYAAVAWSWFFVTIVALSLFWGPDRRLRALLVIGYLGALPVMGLLLGAAGTPALPFANVGLMPPDEAAILLSLASALTGHQVTAGAVSFAALSQPILFWALSAAPVALVAIAFNRFIRATVGPLLITAALAMLLLTFAISDLAIYTPTGFRFLVHIKHITGRFTYPFLLLVSLALSAAIACAGVLWTARRYRRRQLSDQTFLFDTLWLSASFFVCAYLMGDGKPLRYLLGLLPFAVYKTITVFTLKPLQKRGQQLPQASLLFLRVFGSASRSERLFDLLSAHWRYAGSIQLIGATDVARGRFAPDEFLDLLNGRLGKGCISSTAGLDRRLADLNSRPAPDGRYRINEFFCRADTWQETVVRLMERSDLVVMDLRTFTPQKRGCIFELGVLLTEVPLDRVVLLIDRTTNEPFLKQTLADLWRKLNPGSVNARMGASRLTMIDLARGYPATVRRLMEIGDQVIAQTLVTRTAAP